MKLMTRAAAKWVDDRSGYYQARNAASWGLRLPAARFRDAGGCAVRSGGVPRTGGLPGLLGSWCGPCRQSFPWMQTMTTTYEGDGLTVIAVNVDTDRAAADKFLNQFHPTFDVRFDPKGISPNCTRCTACPRAC